LPAAALYIEASLAQGVAPATINRRLQILGQAFRQAFEADVPKVTAVPLIRKLPERNVRQGFLEAAEFAALVAALPDALQDFVRFAYLTGWRAGEIRALRWEWIDRVGGVIRLPASKNGRGRLLVIDGELTEIMRRREQARLVETPDEPRVADLLFHREGRPIVDYRKAWREPVSPRASITSSARR
jgi:integrase